MSQKEELHELLKGSPAVRGNLPRLLQNYMDYAELCSDPEEVFQYMEEKQICVGFARYWRERAQLFCLMGNFREAVNILEKSSAKVVELCSTPE